MTEQIEAQSFAFFEFQHQGPNGSRLTSTVLISNLGAVRLDRDGAIAVGNKNRILDEFDSGKQGQSVQLIGFLEEDEEGYTSPTFLGLNARPKVLRGTGTMVAFALGKFVVRTYLGESAEIVKASYMLDKRRN